MEVMITVKAPDGSTEVLTVPITVNPVTAPVTSGPTAGVSLTPIDGGATYFSKFSPAYPGNAGMFPLAVWYEDVSDSSSAVDPQAGLNTYVMLTGTSTYKQIAANGMYAFPPGPLSGTAGNETVGWITSDEVDMSGTGWYGAPTTAQFTALAANVAELPKDARSKITNFGKGIIFSGDDADCTKMLNQYQDIVSADIYWFTDADVWGASQGGELFGLGRNLVTAEVRRASNYGATVRRMRKLTGGTRPVWGFVELGGPFTYNTPTTALTATTAPYTTQDQIRAAVWHSIIGGAQGIIYFNHTFGGSQLTDHLLRTAYYAPIRTAVIAINTQIKAITAALNGPTATGLLTTTTDCLALAKWNNGQPVIIAGAANNASTTTTFTLKGTWHTATVLNENRSITITNGVFKDTFPTGNTIHIYQLS